LKAGIGLRSYGQKDPLVEYKKESYTLFQDMMDRIEDETVRHLYMLSFQTGAPPQLPFPTDDGDFVEEGEDEASAEAEAAARALEQQRAAQSAALDMTRNIQRKKEKELAGLQFIGGDGTATAATQTVVKKEKVGRNEPCPCGSGKKYKQCHGA